MTLRGLLRRLSLRGSFFANGDPHFYLYAPFPRWDVIPLSERFVLLLTRARSVFFKHPDCSVLERVFTL